MFPPNLPDFLHTGGDGGASGGNTPSCVDKQGDPLVRPLGLLALTSLLPR